MKGVSKRTLIISGVAALLLGAFTAFLLFGNSNSKTQEEPFVEQGFANPPSREEVEEESDAEAWILEQPAEPNAVAFELPAESGTIHLPANMASIRERLQAPENVAVFAVDLTNGDSSDLMAPVENLYVMLKPLHEAEATLDPESGLKPEPIPGAEETEDLEFANDLDEIAYRVVYNAKVAFSNATDFSSGPLKDAAGNRVGQYVTFMSYGERLTQLEVLAGDNVLVLSSTITGEVEAPDYLRTLTLP